MTASTWKGGNGVWTNANKWTNGAPNGGQDDAILASASTPYTVTSTGDVQLGLLEIGDDATVALASNYMMVDSTAPKQDDSLVENLGTLVVGAAASLDLGGSAASDYASIEGRGTIKVQSSPLQQGVLALNAATTNLFDGTIALAGGVIEATQSSAQTLDDVSGTIRGYGEIYSSVSGSKFTVEIGVRGEILAAGAAGQTLVIDVGTELANAGLIESDGAGGLEIEGELAQLGSVVAAVGAITLLNSEDFNDGTTTIDGGASLVLDNSEIVGDDSIAIAAGGLLTNHAGDTGTVGSNGYPFSGDTLDGIVENSGEIAVAAGSVLNLAGYVENSGAGSLVINGGSTLEIFGSAEIDGGSVVLGKSKTSETEIVANGAAATFKNDATISGAGAIGDGWLWLDNGPSGVIDATGVISISGDSSAVTSKADPVNYNGGLIESTGSGELFLFGGIENAGVIDAAGGFLQFDDALDTSGNGLVEATGEGADISLAFGSAIEGNGDVRIAQGAQVSTSGGDTGANADTIEGTVHDYGAINITENSQLIGDGVWQDNGSINLGNSGGAGQLLIADSQSLYLAGTGIVDLAHYKDSITDQNGDTGTLILGGVTLIGAGTIGDSGMSVEFLGGSTVDATGSLTIDAKTKTNDANLVNAGTLEATGGGQLTFEAGIANYGSILVGAGSTLYTGYDVTGEGLIKIGAHATATFESQLDDDISFTSPAGGELVLADPKQFSGDISGFAAGDSIELKGVTLTPSATVGVTANATSATLSLQTSAGALDFIFHGNYVGDTSNWSAANTNGNILITL